MHLYLSISFSCNIVCIPLRRREMISVLTYHILNSDTIDGTYYT